MSFEPESVICLGGFCTHPLELFVCFSFVFVYTVV